MQDIYTRKMPHIALINDARDALHTVSIIGVLYDLAVGIWNRSYNEDDKKHVIQGIFTSQAKSEALNVYFGKIIAQYMQSKGGRSAGWTKGSLASDHFTNDAIMNRLKAIEFNDNDALFKMVITRLLGIDQLLVELALSVTSREKAEKLVAYLALRHELSHTAADAVLDYVDAIDVFERLLDIEGVPHDIFFFEAIENVVEAGRGVVKEEFSDNPLDAVYLFFALAPVVTIEEEDTDPEVAISAALAQHDKKILVKWPDGRRENRYPPRKSVGELLEQYQGCEKIEDAHRETSMTVALPSVPELYPLFNGANKEFFASVELVYPENVGYAGDDRYSRPKHLTQLLTVPVHVPNYLGLCQVDGQTPWTLRDEVNADSLVVKKVAVTGKVGETEVAFFIDTTNMSNTGFAPSTVVCGPDRMLNMFIRQMNPGMIKDQFGKEVGAALFQEFTEAGYEPLFDVKLSGSFNQQTYTLRLASGVVKIVAVRDIGTGEIFTIAEAGIKLRAKMKNFTDGKVVGAELYSELRLIGLPDVDPSQSKAAIDTANGVRVTQYFEAAAENRQKFFEANPRLHALLGDSALTVPQLVVRIREQALDIVWPAE